MATVDVDSAGHTTSADPSRSEKGYRAARAREPGLRLLREAVVQVYRADRAGTLLAASLQIVGAFAALGVLGASKLALDAILSPGEVGIGLVSALMLLALATALSASSGVLQGQQQRLLSERVAQRVWRLVTETTTRVDLIAYERVGFGVQLQRVSEHAFGHPYQVTTTLFSLLGSVLGVVGMSVALIGIEPLLVPILLAAGVPAMLLSRRAGRTEFAFAERTARTEWTRSYLISLLTERPYAAELRAFGSAGLLTARLADLDARYLSVLCRQVRVRQCLALLTTLAVALSLAAALLAIVELVRLGRLDLASAGAAAIGVRMLSRQFAVVFASLGGLVEAVPFLADLDALVATRPSGSEQGRRLPLTDRVTLSEISFTYPEQRRRAVDGVTLTVAAGEVVALVGENGSGKSTLAKIAAGLYEPDLGTIAWDGRSDLTGADIRESVSVVMQDFVEYQMTVRDNISIGDPRREAGDAEITSVAARSRALCGLVPDGLDTVVGRDLDDGVDLSGGQWQRVALARALFRDTSLVVLDEPSAALDPRAEHELFADVRALLDGRAALLISHRFSSVRLADRIYVMDNGRVIEHGTHDELMTHGGRYAELFTLQSRAYR